MSFYTPPKPFLELLAKQLNQDGVSIRRLPAIPHRYWQVTFPSGSEHFLSWKARQLQDWQIGTNRYKPCGDNVRNHVRLQNHLVNCIEIYGKMFTN